MIIRALSVSYVCACALGCVAGGRRVDGSPPLAAPFSSGIDQMGTLIALDCLLHQMKAERSVDIYGVTLRLMRSCCLMTPTPVGGEEGGCRGQVCPGEATARCRTEARSQVQ